MFVKGLPSSCDKHKLLQIFSKFGAVDKTYILYDHNSGSSRGFGFVEFCREEDVAKALHAPVTVDGKTVKCSRVILKQEAKCTQLTDAKPTKGLGDSSPGKKTAQAKTQKSTKSMKQPKITFCEQKEDAGSLGGLTKESSQSNSCEKTGQTYAFDRPRGHTESNHQYDQTIEYKSDRHLHASANRSLFHTQYVHPGIAPQEGNTAALNYGWRLHDQFGSPGFVPGYCLDHELIRQGQEWSQSTQQVCPDWMYQTGAHQSQVAQTPAKKSSYYRMF